MSNLHNQEQLENIHHQLLEQDRKGLIDDEINAVARNYGLNEDDDRDEIINFLAEFIFYDINKIRDNWDSVFGKKKKKLITEVTIEFTMEGNPRINDMNNQVEKMLKENKITYSTVTKYINAWTDY